MKKHIWLLIVFVILLIPNAALAQDDDLGFGSINGIVNEPEGPLIEGVTVVLDDGAKTTQTNLKGYYGIIGIRAGRHTLTCSKDGYEEKTKQVTVQTDMAVTVNIQLHKLAPVPAELQETGTAAIEGLVYLSGGKYIADANLVLDGGVRRAKTSMDGRYRIEGVKAGKHHLMCWRSGYLNLGKEVTTEDNETTTVNFSLRKRVPE